MADDAPPERTTRTGRHRILTELFTAWRFGLVGIAATLTHAGIALALTVSELAHPLVANLIAFLVAFGVSFLGHHFWSFPDPASTARRRRRRMLRFFVLALTGFSANTAALAGWLAWVPLPDALGVLVSIGLIPLVTYLGARLWAFAEPAAPRPEG